MAKLITGLMLVVAFIHVLPITGLLGVSKLESLYAVSISDNDLEILMRHRAVLFGMLGTFIAYAAFKPRLQPVAFIAAFISIASFFYLAYSVGEFNAAIRKVVIADVVAAICLAGSVLLYFLRK